MSTSLRLLTKSDVDHYLCDDAVAMCLASASQPGDHLFASQQWLLEMPAKRAIWNLLYGDLLREHVPRRRIIDIGGGVSSLTRILAERHDYRLVEMCAHDSAESIRRIERELGNPFLIAEDWYSWIMPESIDLVIANDIFPNVDQRLSLFLQKFSPVSRELRVSLTFYNSPRFHFARRVDAAEIFCQLAWDGDMTGRVLSKYLAGSELETAGKLQFANESLYSNGRQICILQANTSL